MKENQLRAMNRSLALETIRKYVKDCNIAKAPHQITANEDWNFDIRMYQNIIVRAPYTLTISCLVMMPDDAKIYVESGASLEIVGKITKACAGGDFTNIIYDKVFDLNIKDIPSDDGTEPSPLPPYLLVDGNDIWIRNYPDSLTATNPPRYEHEHQHEDADFSVNWKNNQNSRPRIYVKVRNRGAEPVTGYVKLYYHKLSTNDKWNRYNPITNTYGSWEEILCGDTDGDGRIGPSETLCGDMNSNVEIDGSEVYPATLTLNPGEEGVIEQIRNNVAQDEFLDPLDTSNRHEWCLLARLESMTDPIKTELYDTSAAVNAKNSNNIVQKNVMFINDSVNGIVVDCNLMEYGNFSGISTTNQLRLIDNTTAPFLGNSGRLKVDLGKPLYDAWVRGGKLGSGFQEASGNCIHSVLGVCLQVPALPVVTPFNINPEQTYTLNIIGHDAYISNINLPPYETHPICVSADYYPGPASTEPFEYHLAQYESRGLNNYNYVGAVKALISKPACPEINAGSDVTVGRGCKTTLIATPSISDAVYGWFNSSTGAYLGSGETIEVSPLISTTYEVHIATPERCIDRDDVRININPNPGLACTPVTPAHCVTDISLSPNPVMANTLTLKFSASKTINLDIVATNQMGVVKLAQTVIASVGINTHILNIGNLTGGVYNVRISCVSGEIFVTTITRL